MSEIGRRIFVIRSDFNVNYPNKSMKLYENFRNFMGKLNELLINKKPVSDPESYQGSFHKKFVSYKIFKKSFSFLDVILLKKLPFLLTATTISKKSNWKPTRSKHSDAFILYINVIYVNYKINH